MNRWIKPAAALVLAAALFMPPAMGQDKQKARAGGDVQSTPRQQMTSREPMADRGNMERRDTSEDVQWRAEDQDWWEDEVKDTLKVYGPVGSYEYGIEPSREKIAARTPDKTPDVTTDKTTTEPKAEARQPRAGERREPVATEKPRQEAKRQDVARAPDRERVNGQEWDRY